MHSLIILSFMAGIPVLQGADSPRSCPDLWSYRFPRRADDGKNSPWRRMYFGVGGAADGQRTEAETEEVEKENYTYSV